MVRVEFGSRPLVEYTISSSEQVYWERLLASIHYLSSDEQKEVIYTGIFAMQAFSGLGTSRLDGSPVSSHSLEASTDFSRMAFAGKSFSLCASS